MADDRIPTSLLIEAVLRKCNLDCRPVYIAQKGAFAAGTIMLKQNGLENGCQVLFQIRDFDGNLTWMKAFENENVDEAKADEYIKRAIKTDSDLWVIEIEDKEMNNPFEGE